MGERCTVEGTVQHVIFQNEENGYTVLGLLTEEGELVTVVGCIPCVAPGEKLTADGLWVSHPSYGQQFAAETVERLMPETEEELISYLSSGIIKGVGPATAERLVERFGGETLAVIEEEPERLSTVKGITSKRAMEISAAFRELTGLRRVMEFLARYELPVELAMRLYRTYGADALPRLRADPYLLAGERYGVAFADVDEIALSMGFGGDSPCRTEAAVLYELEHNLGNGHVFLPRPKLLAATEQLIGAPPEPGGAGAGHIGEPWRRGGGADRTGGRLLPAPDVSGRERDGPAAAGTAGCSPITGPGRGEADPGDGGAAGHRLCPSAASGGGAGGPHRRAAADPAAPAPARPPPHGASWPSSRAWAFRCCCWPPQAVPPSA